MIILNERECAERCLKIGLFDNNPYLTLSILAKYYYHHMGFRKKKIAGLLLDYLTKYYPKYELNKNSWQTSIDKLAANAGKYPLFEIPGVRVTQSEMQTIKNLNNKVLERLAFTMLCLAKLANIKNPANNNWVNADSKDLFKYARISSTILEREKKVGKLWDLGLIEFSKRNDNLNCRVTFVNDDDTEELFVFDFRELGYEYLKYKGENFIRCAECNILTRGNKAGTKKYCNECAAYTPQITKTIKCVDCGKEITVDSKNTKSRRCKECQLIVNREKKRAWKQNTQK